MQNYHKVKFLTHIFTNLCWFHGVQNKTHLTHTCNLCTTNIYHGNTKCKNYKRILYMYCTSSIQVIMKTSIGIGFINLLLNGQILQLWYKGHVCLRYCTLPDRPYRVVIMMMERISLNITRYQMVQDFHCFYDVCQLAAVHIVHTLHHHQSRITVSLH